MTRQQKRSTERRSYKMEPGTVQRTSARHIGRTKGDPYSRMKLVSITPSKVGEPAVFNVKSHTRKGGVKSIKATYQNIEWFVKGLPHNMKMSMLG